MAHTEKLKYILDRYLHQEASEGERQKLFAALKRRDRGLEEALKEVLDAFPEDKQYDPNRWAPVIEDIIAREAAATTAKKRGLWYWGKVAAVVVLVAGGGAIGWGMWQTHRQTMAPPHTLVHSAHTSIVPGGNKAVLILAGGESITLDSVQQGTIAMQGKTKVLKVDSGLLSYQEQTAAATAASSFNTIKTPRGGQYQVVLSDGSKVWLNAASSLRFPTAFSAKERRVTVQGEAYFEIAEDPNRPFIVSAGPMRVQVLGTRFNIMAYGNEPVMQTTLLDGAVKVDVGETDHRMIPGQQATVKRSGSGTVEVTDGIDIQQTVAWTKGLFQFTDESIGAIMRQIARWYDVQIAYPKGVPEGHITGKIPRNTNLSDVLKIMKLSGVAFKIEGRAIIVLPHS